MNTTVAAEHLSALVEAREAFPVLYFTPGEPGNLALWDSNDPAPGPVALRRAELIAIYDQAWDDDSFDDGTIEIQKIIDANLNRENSP